MESDLLVVLVTTTSFIIVKDFSGYLLDFIIGLIHSVFKLVKIITLTVAITLLIDFLN